MQPSDPADLVRIGWDLHRMGDDVGNASLDAVDECGKIASPCQSTWWMTMGAVETGAQSTRVDPNSSSTVWSWPDSAVRQAPVHGVPRRVGRPIALPARDAGPAATMCLPMQTIAVIDFETTGSAPGQGARATEIAAVLVQGEQIVDRYQSLMNSGAWVPPFIERLTGISNAMLADAPPAEQVMRQVLHFTRGCPLVAHNAAFDRAFWRAEAGHAGGGIDPAHAFACTVRLSRRLYPQAPNHRLGTLAHWHHLPTSGRAHRALADASTTAQLLLRIQHDLRQRLGRGVDHALLCELQEAPVAQLDRCLARIRARDAADGAPGSPSAVAMP